MKLLCSTVALEDVFLPACLYKGDRLYSGEKIKYGFTKFDVCGVIIVIE